MDLMQIIQMIFGGGVVAGIVEICAAIRHRKADKVKAVGCNPDTGAWNTGLLSTDNVHPTATGSYVLMRQMVVDFPEIAVL